VLLYPGGQYVRVVHPLLEPGAKDAASFISHAGQTKREARETEAAVDQPAAPKPVRQARAQPTPAPAPVKQAKAVPEPNPHPNRSGKPGLNRKVVPLPLCLPPASQPIIPVSGLLPTGAPPASIWAPRLPPLLRSPHAWPKPIRHRPAPHLPRPRRRSLPPVSASAA